MEVQKEMPVEVALEVTEETPDEAGAVQDVPEVTEVAPSESVPGAKKKTVSNSS